MAQVCFRFQVFLWGIYVDGLKESDIRLNVLSKKMIKQTRCTTLANYWVQCHQLVNYLLSLIRLILTHVVISVVTRWQFKQWLHLLNKWPAVWRSASACFPCSLISLILYFMKMLQFLMTFRSCRKRLL